MAELFQSRNIKVVALVTEKHLAASTSNRQDGKKLTDFADLVLDTGAPAGDSMMYLEGLETPVSPGSTAGGIMIVNCIKAELAQILTDAGEPPKVLTASAVVGSERSRELFESAYDEHSDRMSKVFQNPGR